MLDEVIKQIVEETVKMTLRELGTLEKGDKNVPDTLTVKQAAQYLGMSESWIYQNIKELPHEKRGRSLRFNKSELDQWREERREEKALNKQKSINICVNKNKRLYKII